VVAISAGKYYSLALLAGGTVVAWGDNTYGARDVPTGLHDAVAVAAGYTSCLALRSDGTLVAWSRWPDAYSTYSLMTVPAGLSNVVRIAAGYAHALALRADGSVFAWGLNSDKQTNVPAGLTMVAGLAAGYAHSLALLGNGPPVTQAPAASLMRTGPAFSLEIPTQNGRVYALEYKQTLADTNWLALPLSAGKGGVQTLADPPAFDDSRFYRVRSW
jgi:hypothetical protein